MKHLPLSIYGWTYWLPILAGGAIMVVTLALIQPWAAVVVAVFVLACLAFFRDFPRNVPQDANVMVAPADGKVTDVSVIPAYEPFGGPALRVGIFLSVLDVHVNRSPCDGVILWTKFEDGQFLDARHPECGIRNQSNTIGMGDAAETPTRVVVKQIVGAIARRIICPITAGESFARGERIGMIAFGSRTELYVPSAEGWEAAVRVGQHVKAGSQIILKKAGK